MEIKKKLVVRIALVDLCTIMMNVITCHVVCNHWGMLIDFSLDYNEIGPSLRTYQYNDNDLKLLLGRF